MKKKIAHFGAFDHDSYGDLIFPLLTEEFLGSEFEVVHVSPAGAKTNWRDAKNVISVEAAAARDDWSGILVGGGDIVQAGDWVPAQWRASIELRLGALASLWIGAGMLAARLGIPMAWNAPGVPGKIPAYFEAAAQFSISVSDYISVRDVNSRALISPLSSKTVHVVPDTAVLLARIWPQREMERKSGYFVSCASAADSEVRGDDITRAIHALASDRDGPGLATKELPLMSWQHSERVNSLDLRKLPIEREDCLHSLEYCAGIIASSDGYIGNSLHGFVTAVAYGRRAVLVIPVDAPLAHKYAGFIESIGGLPSQHIAENWCSAATLLKNGSPLKLSPTVEDGVEKHWEKIREILRLPPQESKIEAWKDFEKKILSQTGKSVIYGLTVRSVLEKMEEKNAKLSEISSAHALRFEGVERYCRELEVHVSEKQNALESAKNYCDSVSRRLIEKQEREIELENQLRLKCESLASEGAQMARLTNELQRTQEYAHALETRVSHGQNELRNLKLSLNSSIAALAGERLRLDELKRLADHEKIQLQTERDEAESNEARMQAERDELAEELQRLSGRLEETSTQLHEVMISSSWRLSAPLRELSARFPRLRQLASKLLAHPPTRKVVRRSAKLLWWTATLQLPQKLAVRQAARKRIFVETTRPSATADLAVTTIEAAVATDTTSMHLEKHDPLVEIVAPPRSPKQEFVEIAQHELETFLSSNERLSLSPQTKPLISVIIVAWNSAYFTLKCLRALCSEMTAPDCPAFEVIVVDNASSDETKELLAVADGIRWVKSDSNLGFLKGCNLGARHASGEALLLLNTDAFVRVGAIKAAWDALNSKPNIGAVGARLVLPTGLLQEAGSIVWSDGSTVGYCRGALPEVSEAMFRREVDYCSGAFLLTRTYAWRALNGLDESFAPAYYEEVDYCFRLREKGLRTVYEPHACVDHFEYGSEAKSGDAIAQSIKNQKKFKILHGARLRGSCFRPSNDNFLIARSCQKYIAGRVLFIDNEIPFEALGSGYPRARAMLNAAATAGWATTFLSLHNPVANWPRIREEFHPEIEFITEPTIVRLSQFLEERHGYYDVAVISRPDNMKAVAEILDAHPHLLRGTKIIYDAEALFSVRDVLRAEWFGEDLPPKDAVKKEILLAKNSDALICVTESEAEAFRAVLDVPVEILSHAVAVSSSVAPFEDRCGFLFVGRLLEPTSPNWIGLRWFVREVWPLIRLNLPAATLEIVGHVHHEHAELAGPGIRILGPIENLAVVWSSARVFVAPIHFAAGIPIKIIEASASGLPVIGTTLMAKQLGWTAGEEIQAHDDPREFALAAIELHERKTDWENQSASALRMVIAEHSAAEFDARLLRILDASLDRSDDSHREHGWASGAEANQSWAEPKIKMQTSLPHEDEELDAVGDAD
ncbi:glycosyltransferase [Variovorax sp. tm]|uniref:glycosyltransferase n=1 Tax=Variovorax atrisoli TaxID=3394203 RepID=UPI003A80F0D6